MMDPLGLISTRQYCRVKENVGGIISCNSHAIDGCMLLTIEKFSTLYDIQIQTALTIHCETTQWPEIR